MYISAKASDQGIASDFRISATFSEATIKKEKSDKAIIQAEIDANQQIVQESEPDLIEKDEAEVVVEMEVDLDNGRISDAALVTIIVFIALAQIVAAVTVCLYKHGFCCCKTLKEKSERDSTKSAKEEHFKSALNNASQLDDTSIEMREAVNLKKLEESSGADAVCSPNISINGVNFSRDSASELLPLSQTALAHTS